MTSLSGAGAAMSTVMKAARLISVSAVLLASGFQSAMADTVSTSAMTNPPPNYLTQSSMLLTLSAAAPGPKAGTSYTIYPVTAQAGLNQTGNNSLRAFNVQGQLAIANEANFASMNGSGTIALLSCDSNAASSFISPSDMLNSLMGSNLLAILLYSEQMAYCSLQGTPSVNTVTSIWTTSSPDDAAALNNATSSGTGAVMASITGNGTQNSSGNDGGGQSNSAVAMSILYSITGIITLLFLIIIATGAVRAQRHPERYGPRAGLGGRPRQSRAKGIARAMLDSLPIVKFGDSTAPKPDPEAELENVSTHRRPSITSATRPAPSDSAAKAAGEPSPNNAEQNDHENSNTAANPSAATNSGVQEQSSCSICTEDFATGEDVRVLPCNHQFHPACVDPWLLNVSGTCPLCRLDLHSNTQNEGESSQEEHIITTVEEGDISEHNHPEMESRLTPPPGLEAETGEPEDMRRRRLSRLLDWNRLRHASVDERLQALRQYRTEQQAGDEPAAEIPGEDRRSHAKLSDRLREKFHIKTRTLASNTRSPSRSPSPGERNPSS